MENPYEKLLAGLVEAGVEFLTVGGIACALNGHVRSTEDVDILVSRTDDNLRRMLTALTKFGEGHARELELADFPDEEGAVRIVEDFPLDIFVRMGGKTYDELSPHRQTWDAGDVPIPFVDIQGLLSLKQDSLRERDKLDCLVLKGLLESDDEDQA